MCRFCVNSALKSRHSRRVELRASCKVMTCYFSCALTELISRQIMRGTRGVAATSHLKASAPKLKYGAMAVRHRMQNRVWADWQRR
jgi:hypothetical protein